MKLGLGLRLGGSGNRLPRYVTDFANGFELPGNTYTGGPTVVADNTGTLVTSPADTLPIEGMRLTDGVWLPTDLSGDPIHASTPLRTTKGSVKKYDETYKGPLIEPARTNLFLNSTVPVTRNITTTAQQYTVTVKGTGSVTLSGTATGVAMDGSPLTVTATAGTLTCTVAGTLSRVNVEDGAFGTSFIDTGATTVTRPAANLTRPTAGTALESGNDFAIYGRVFPEAGGQTSADYLFCTYVNIDNYIDIRADATGLAAVKKAGSAYILRPTLTIIGNTLLEFIVYQHSVHGMGIAVRSWNGSVWSAWSTWETNADTQNAPIASTYQIGARNNASHFAGNYPFTEIIKIPASVEPQAWLIDKISKNRI